MGRVHGVPIRPITRASLRADCGACAGLPCPHLDTDFRCAIHAHLVERGFPGWLEHPGCWR